MSSELPAAKSVYDGDLRYYNLWYNEQPSRIFREKDSNLSFNDVFTITNDYICKNKSFIQWCDKHQNGLISFYPGSPASSVLNVSHILNNYVKSAMGLPFYDWGNVYKWTLSNQPLIQEIGFFTKADKMDRYLLLRQLMTSSLGVIFKDLPFKDLFINAMITVYHSETAMEVSVHNSYESYGRRFVKNAPLSSIGQPKSTAFGLGQWLGSRLLDYFYFVADKYSLLGDARDIGPEILYHPALQVGFMAFEFRPGSKYHSIISNQLTYWKSRKVTPTYLQMVELILEKIQVISRSNTEFASKEKVSIEQRLVNRIPLDYKTTFNLTPLIS